MGLPARALFLHNTNFAKCIRKMIPPPFHFSLPLSPLIIPLSLPRNDAHQRDAGDEQAASKLYQNQAWMDGWIGPFLVLEDLQSWSPFETMLKWIWHFVNDLLVRVPLIQW